MFSHSENVTPLGCAHRFTVVAGEHCSSAIRDFFPSITLVRTRSINAIKGFLPSPYGERVDTTLCVGREGARGMPLRNHRRCVDVLAIGEDSKKASPANIAKNSPR